MYSSSIHHNNFPSLNSRSAISHLSCCCCCMPAGGLKAQLYKSVINHRQRCGKQQAKAMLVQHCPPCLLVKGTAALHWKRLMCARYHLVNITSLENSQCVLTEGKQMLWEQREAPLLPLQFNSTGRFMHTIQFVCRVGEHEAYCMSRAIYQTLLCSLYWLSMSAHSKKSQQSYSHRRSIKVCQKWEISCGKKCEGEVENVFYHSAYSAFSFTHNHQLQTML